MYCSRPDVSRAPSQTCNILVASRPGGCNTRSINLPLGREQPCDTQLQAGSPNFQVLRRLAIEQKQRRLCLLTFWMVSSYVILAGTHHRLLINSDLVTGPDKQ
ncbi:hypothetical protein RRG08_064491 [Elysia crispata]|uniref:Uncharacterized protein n=1 Tax=Elysia crispata TaxID=231223 RepID=A0AAE1AEM7_9GAST|nr:hypothetical protein RRG08_064491 [Elysia crispata]